ncbi:outer membrane protein assembly factor BamA [Candidatus Neomarinimicrobiota bacterium]
MKIRSITFKENHVYTAKRLRSIMVSKPYKFYRKSFFIPELLEQDCSTIELFYRQQGYLDAAVVDTDISADSLQLTVSISITVKEGPQTRVEDVSILGNINFSDDVLLSFIQMKPGDAFSMKAVEAANLALLRFYAGHGYLEAVVQPDIVKRVDEQLAAIHFEINENQQFSIDQINVKGLGITQPRIVERELQFSTGEIISYSNLVDSQRELYMTGLFESVFITPQPPTSKEPNEKDVLVEVSENMPKELNVSLGYWTVEKLVARIEMMNTNISGSGKKMSARASGSFIERSLEWSFTNQRIFDTRWGFDANTFTKYNKHPGYQLYSSGFKLSVGRKLRNIFNMSISFLFENGNLISAQSTQSDEFESTRTRSLSLSIIRDMRDNIFDSKKGYYFDYSNEFSGKFLNSTTSHTRSNLNYRYFHSIAPLGVIATDISIGWIFTRDGLETLPLNDRYYAGGPNSLRAFEYRRVGPLTPERIPTGGLVKLEWHIIELRRPIYKNLLGALFIDAGNVWERADQVTMSSIRVGFGGGLRINSPIGLLRFDCSLNPYPHYQEQRIKIYFSAGQAF